MQRAVNATIEEAVFSMRFVYIHCRAKNVFSMVPPRDYISGAESNETRIEEERTRMERIYCELF
jgi:hypothetical protein